MTNFLSLSLSFLLLFHGCLALRSFQQQRNECQFQRMNALEPNDVVKAEAGYTEFFDSGDQQFRCAGVEVIRHHIQPQGLLLPSYLNTPLVVYILQGRGYAGIMLPGCPETFQSPQQPQGRRVFQDRHQKIHRFVQGDVIVIPTGAAHWMYNDGQEEVIALVLLDTTNSANQLDQFHRRFFLAGNPKEGEQQQHPEEGSGNIFRGFNLEILAEVFNVDQETAQKLQNPDDNRGHIVMVERGLQVIKPPIRIQQEQSNGFEETICSAKMTSNMIDVDAYRADLYNPQPGWLTILDSSKLPILKSLKLSVERGVLKKNIIVSPYWIMNAHNIVHVIKGSAKVQIVNNEGQRVFDDVINEGQMIVVPQTFGALKQAGEEGCEFVSFRTNDNVMVSSSAGDSSVIRAMPVGLIMKAYDLSLDQALSVKYKYKKTGE